MAADRVSPSSVPAEVTALAGRVRPLRPVEVNQSLGSRLVPIVDQIRHLNTVFGIRPYRVFLVHVAWSGGRRGAGTAVEVSRVEILPTPNVGDMTSTSELLRSTGLTEEGGLTITEISARFAEDDLMGRTPDLQDPSLQITGGKNLEFFWEVVENRTQDPTAIRRRYVPAGAPNVSRDGFQWKVVLNRQSDAGNRQTGALTPRSEF